MTYPEKCSWPKMEFKKCEIRERISNLPQIVMATTLLDKANEIDKLDEAEYVFKRCSAFKKLNRVLTHCLRFRHNTRQSNSDNLIGELSETELKL